MKSLKRLFLLLWIIPVLLNAQAAAPFFFVQLADPQFGMYPLQKGFYKERRNLSRAVEAINRLQPDFVVICGDLVNRASDSRQIAAYREIMSRLNPAIPLYLVPGNHDVGNRPSTKSLERYRKNFGEDFYSFKRHGIRFLVLNTSLVKDPSNAQKEAAAQLKWLKTVLDSAQSEHSNVVVFQHQPWFVENAHEPNGYFNIPRKTRMEYLKLLESHDVSYVFAGHLHANAAGSYGSLMIVTSGPVGMPLGKDPSGIRIVMVRPSGIEHRYYVLKDIPRSIDLNNSTGKPPSH